MRLRLCRGVTVHTVVNPAATKKGEARRFVVPGSLTYICHDEEDEDAVRAAVRRHARKLKDGDA